MTLLTSSLESFKKVSRWASSSEFFEKPLRGKRVYTKLSKKHFCWRLSNRSCIFESKFCFPGISSLPLCTCVKEPHFGKTCICREMKSIIVVKVLSVSCVSFKGFKASLSVNYGKRVLPTYLEQNIKQVWKFNILWVSSKTKFSVLLNARHREICLKYLLKSFPSVSLEKRYFMFLVYLNE